MNSKTMPLKFCEYRNRNMEKSVLIVVMETATTTRKRFSPSQLALLTDTTESQLEQTKAQLLTLRSKIETEEIDEGSTEVKQALGYLHGKLGRLYNEAAKH